MSGKFVISKSSNGKYHFSLKAGNGEIILASQMYEQLDGVRVGIESARQNAPKDEMYERAKSKKDEPYFNLLAANKQVIGRSEMYSSERARDNGIESVKKNAPDATVEDNSAG